LQALSAGKWAVTLLLPLTSTVTVAHPGRFVTLPGATGSWSDGAVRFQVFMGSFEVQASKHRASNTVCPRR
jgi:hypothetical protein